MRVTMTVIQKTASRESSTKQLEHRRYATYFAYFSNINVDHHHIKNAIQPVSNTSQEKYAIFLDPRNLPHP